MEVRLTLETARSAGLPVETELFLETTADSARELAAKLVSEADRADKLNRDENLPVRPRDIKRR